MVISSYLLPLLLILSFAYFLLRQTPKDRSKGPPAKAWQLTVKGRHFLEWSVDRLLSSPSITITLPGGGIFPGGGILTANPNIIEHVLKTNFPNYPKSHGSKSALADFLGDGIFNTDGPSWHLQRKLASPAFHSRSLRYYLTHVFHHEISDRLLPVLSRAAASLCTVDLQSILERFAFDSICRVAFGFDSSLLSPTANDTDSIAANFYRAYESSLALTLNRFQPQPWRLFRFLSVGGEAWLKEELAILDTFVARVIDDTKKTRPNCLLLPFLDAEEFDEKKLRDMVTNFILAGRDSISSALTWFFYLVSSRPAVREKILQEISSIRSKRGDDGVLYDVEELKEMEYLHAAITEAMRLYPPLPLDARCSAMKDELPGGRKVKKGCLMIFNMYAMGRMPAVWGEDCCEYRPERWLDGTGVFQPGNLFRYPIFFAGPRMCLGKEMAYMEMKAAAAAIVDRFEFDLVGEAERRIEVVTVLRMKGGFSVKVRERCAELDKQL